MREVISPKGSRFLLCRLSLTNRSRFQAAGLPCDLPGTIQIAKWVYQQTEEAKGQVWVEEKMLQHLGPAWLECLSA
jgi:hypothetical protein